MSGNADKLAKSTKLVFVHSVLRENSAGDGAILIMRDGSFRMILKSSTVNFQMKSSIEKGTLTYGWGALCDSLEVGFPIQVCSHSKLLDPRSYTDQFQPRLKNQNTHPKVKQLINSHIEQFREQVQHSQLMQREIFIVIPWKGIEPPEKENAMRDMPLASFFKNMSQAAEDDKEMDPKNKPDDMEMSLARQQLQTRSNQILARLSAFGLTGYKLDIDEVQQLLYSFYHPDLSERQSAPGFTQGSSLLGGFSSEMMHIDQEELFREEEERHGVN